MDARIIYLEEIPYFNADILSTTTRLLLNNNLLIEQKVEDEPPYYYVKEPIYQKESEDDYSFFNFPCLLEFDGVTPWHDGNQFLWFLLLKHWDEPSFEFMNLKAKALLKYKQFIEDRFDNELLISFNAKRPAHRATYAYYAYLLEQDIAAATLNMNTGVVYEFYKWLSNEPGTELDIDRVDATEIAWIKFKNRNPNFGHRKRSGKTVTVRSQTSSLPNAKPTPRGFIRDEGEDLRPLKEYELDILLTVLRKKQFSEIIRLIFQFALDTGARKQTILTVRRHHIEQMRKEKPDSSGCYQLKCGPSTGINTKNNKRLSIYLPSELVERLWVFLKSETYVRRVTKFHEKHPDVLGNKNMYVFLSQKGDCLYMAKDDPRYRKTRSKPKGEYLSKLTNKIKSLADKTFPQDFIFHWTRATFALRYYEYMREASKSGLIDIGDEIKFVQKRLSHQNRKTTENYLKLFNMEDKMMEMTEKHEFRIFPSIKIEE